MFHYRSANSTHLLDFNNKVYENQYLGGSIYKQAHHTLMFGLVAIGDECHGHISRHVSTANDIFGMMKKLLRS